METHFASPLCLPLGPRMVQALGRMIDAIGSPSWFDRVLDFLGTVSAVDSGGAMVFHRHQRPRRIVHRFNPQ